MNSKQRKQAERLKKDMEFMLPVSIQKLHAAQEALKQERAELHEWHANAQAHVKTLQGRAEVELKEKHAESMKRLSETRDELARRENDVVGFERGLRERAKNFEEKMKEMESGKILGDVLLHLELDGEPVEIAHALRVRFGLAIPEW